MKKIISPLLLVFAIIMMASCVVPKKKFLAMQHERDSLQNGLNIANIKIDSLTKALSFHRDTINNLRAQVQNLDERLKLLTDQTNTLSENYKQLRANSTDEIKKLIKELETAQANLAARERRLQEVEDAMARRDAAVKALRDKFISMGHARAIISIPEVEKQLYVLKEINSACI